MSDSRELVPLAGSVALRPGSGVIGRESEQAAPADVVRDRWWQGRRTGLLISGEAGQGKTTLVAEVARNADDDGFCVLAGYCEEDLAAPYHYFARR